MKTLEPNFFGSDYHMRIKPKKMMGFGDDVVLSKNYYDPLKLISVPPIRICVVM